MKNLFYVLAAGFLLASCTTDTTCTCTFDGMDLLPDVVTVTECIGCNSQEADDFAAICDELGAIESWDCVID